MNLSDYELFPGVVQSVKDDECLGRIKVSLSSGESASNTQIEAMPWAYPISMTGTYQGFSKLLEGSKVWVLRNKIDNLELWYWPMADYNKNTQDIIDSYDNVDILISRDMGGKNVYIYYKDSEGIVVSIGQSKVTINDKGEVVLGTGQSNIKLAGENVLLNTEDTTNHAVRCEPLTECLNKILECLNGIQMAASQSGFTQHISTNGNFQKALGELNSMCSSNPGWVSENLFVS